MHQLHRLLRWEEGKKNRTFLRPLNNLLKITFSLNNVSVFLSDLYRLELRAMS